MQRPALLLLLPLLAGAQDLVQDSIDAGGVTRTYRYYAPPQASGKLPLVFILHGAGGTAERLAPVVRFERLAAAKRFLVVYPDAFEKHWNDLRGIPEWTSHQRNIDDIGFFSALIDRFIARHNADPKRIFVAGISNGGLMSHRLGCELAGKIAAIAPVVRTFTNKLSDACRPARPIPVHMFFGTADKLVPFAGGIQKMGSAETPVLSAQQTIDRWAALNACSKPPSVTKTAEPAGTRQVFSGCRDNAEVVAYIREGAGHSWPPDATELIWAFFEKHPMR
jgi:polyhydroxybutyrate depolymerase